VKKVQCRWWQLLIRSGNHKCFFCSTYKVPRPFICLSPLSATDVEGGGCMTEGVCVHAAGGVSTWAWKGREDEGVRTQQMEPMKVNLFDNLWSGCVHVIHQIGTSAESTNVTGLQPGFFIFLHLSQDLKQHHTVRRMDSSIPYICYIKSCTLNIKRITFPHCSS